MEKEVILLDDFEKLKRQVETIQRDRDRAAGARDQIVKRIREEFGCKSLKEAEALLRRLEEEERTAAVKYAKKKQLFEKEWKDVLGNL